MSSSSSFSPARIALIGTGVVAAATVSYAIYFDHRRRHDADFRKKLQKEHRQHARSQQAQQVNGRAEASAALRRALVLIASEPVPADVQAKEAYFMEQVGFGEQLAARSPEHYVAAAVSFYRALKVYPAPTELITIYQKTQPPQVFEYVMELVTLDVAAAQAAQARASANLSSLNDPRDAPSSDAILTEIEPTPAASENGSGASTSTDPSTNGSFVHVDEEEKVAVVVDGEGDGEAEVVVEKVTVEASEGEDPPEAKLEV